MKHNKLTTLIISTLIACQRLQAIDLLLLDDAQVQQANPTYNYGANGNLAVTSTAGSQRYSFLRFDVHNSLPANTREEDIEQAWLYLYVNTATTPGKFTLHKVTGELWTIATNTIEGKGTGTASNTAINWNRSNNVATMPIITVNYTGGQDEEYIAINVTSLVKEWLNNPANLNYGLALKPTGVTGEAVNLQFDTKENTAAGNHARIVVTLDKKRVAPRGDVTMGTFTNGPQP